MRKQKTNTEGPAMRLRATGFKSGLNCREKPKTTGEMINQMLTPGAEAGCSVHAALRVQKAYLSSSGAADTGKEPVPLPWSPEKLSDARKATVGVLIKPIAVD